MNEVIICQTATDTFTVGGANTEFHLLILRKWQCAAYQHHHHHHHVLLWI